MIGFTRDGADSGDRGLPKYLFVTLKNGFLPLPKGVCQQKEELLLVI